MSVASAPTAAVPEDAGALFTALADASIISPWIVRNAMITATVTMASRSGAWLAAHTAVAASLAAAYAAALNELRFKAVRECALDGMAALVNVVDAAGSAKPALVAALPDIGALLRATQDADKEVAITLRAKRLRQRWDEVSA